MKKKKFGDFLIPKVAAFFVIIGIDFLMKEPISAVEIFNIYMLIIISWDLEGVKRVINRD